jgi:hypothetical protein
LHSNTVEVKRLKVQEKTLKLKSHLTAREKLQKPRGAMVGSPCPNSGSAPDHQDCSNLAKPNLKQNLKCNPKEQSLPL